MAHKLLLNYLLLLNHGGLCAVSAIMYFNILYFSYNNCLTLLQHQSDIVLQYSISLAIMGAVLILDFRALDVSRRHLSLSVIAHPPTMTADASPKAFLILNFCGWSFYRQSRRNQYGLKSSIRQLREMRPYHL